MALRRQPCQETQERVEAWVGHGWGDMGWGGEGDMSGARGSGRHLEGRVGEIGDDEDERKPEKIIVPGHLGQ